MLEEILKKINSNLERIAKAQEKMIEIYYDERKSLAEYVDLKEGEVKELLANPAVNTVETAVNNPVVANSQPTVNTAVQNQMQQPVQATQPIPTTQIQESFTQEQLAVAMSNAVSAGKMELIQKILQSFNVQALTQLKPEDFNKLATVLKENGVEV